MLLSPRFQNKFTRVWSNVWTWSNYRRQHISLLRSVKTFANRTRNLLVLSSKKVVIKGILRGCATDSHFPILKYLKKSCHCLQVESRIIESSVQSTVQNEVVIMFLYLFNKNMNNSPLYIQTIYNKRPPHLVGDRNSLSLSLYITNYLRAQFHEDRLRCRGMKTGQTNQINTVSLFYNIT